MTDIQNPAGDGKADLAFEAHAALLQIEAKNPELKNNPCWTMLRQDAYERFAVLFEAGE